MRYKVIFGYRIFGNNPGFAGQGTLNLSDTALIVTGNRPTFGFLQYGFARSIFTKPIFTRLTVPTLRTIPYATISAYNKPLRWHYLTYKLPDGKYRVFAFHFPDNDGNRFATQLEEYRLTVASLYMKK